MSVGSEREEELQEERGVPQLEARLQHGSEHVRSPQVWTLTGRHRHGETACLPAGVLGSDVEVVPLFRAPTEQPERPGGLSADDCHPEPRPGPQRSQQLLHTEVGQTVSDRPRVCGSVSRPLTSRVCVCTRV